MVLALLVVLLRARIISLASGTPRNRGQLKKTVTEVTRSLADVGWQHTNQGSYLHWKPEEGDVRLTLDALAAQSPNDTSTTWGIWAGPDVDHLKWAINASHHTPAAVLSHLAGELAYGIGASRQPTRRRGNPRSSIRGAAIPPPLAKPSPLRISK
ncbi:DUF317 domain-containing protein [Streptomyces sp. NPDC006134]|uniref:DUF317 domain-containing protein n=1 Tax=Streptomyces sp. NPDC006134 TaxID=3154467 RepID=UPI00340DD9AA